MFFRYICIAVLLRALRFLSVLIRVAALLRGLQCEDVCQYGGGGRADGFLCLFLTPNA